MQHSTLSVHILWLSAVVLGIRSTASRSPVVWALHLGLRYGSLWGVSKLRCWIIEHIPVRPVIPCILYTCNPAMTSIIQVFYSILWTGIPAVLACKRCRHGRLGHRHCLHLWQWIETYFLKFVKFVTLFLADSKQTTAGTLHMTCWRLLQIFYSGGWDECQNECLCIIAK
jgi:hypothetical protein